MKKNTILILIICLSGMLSICCTDAPNKIERYIKRNYNMNTRDTAYIDLRKALNIEYDTLYVFPFLTTIAGVRDIIGIENYDARGGVVGYDSEMCRIIFVKNNTVIYEDEYHYYNYNVEISFTDFDTIQGVGFFDGKPLMDDGYFSDKHIFKIIKKENKYYIKRID